MKRTILFLFAMILCISCCSCSPKWPEKSLMLAHTVELIQYSVEDRNVKTIYTVTDKEAVGELCRAFSDFDLKSTHIREMIDPSFYITFFGQNGEIDHITVIAGRNTVQDKHGDLYNILSETDINSYLNEFLASAPSKVERDPDEDYAVNLSFPALNKTFGKNDEPPVFVWTVLKGIPQEFFLEIDYLNNGTYMTKHVIGSVSHTLSVEEWEKIKTEAPIVGGVQKIQWRIRIDPKYHKDLESYYTSWGYFWIDQNN